MLSASRSNSSKLRMFRIHVLIRATICLLVATSTIALAQKDPPPSNPKPPLQQRQGPPPKTDAPAPCDISMSSLPRFADVYMGMPYDDVASVYPEIRNDKHFHKTFDQDGSGVFTIQAKDTKTPVKDDTSQISLNFKDRAVWIISLVFVPDKWGSLKDAVAESSRILGVTEDSWKISHGESGEITCVDFRFFISSLPGEPRTNSLAIHPLRY